jgi:hypothetical protein
MKEFLQDLEYPLALSFPDRSASALHDKATSRAAAFSEFVRD